MRFGAQVGYRKNDQAMARSVTVSLGDVIVDVEVWPQVLVANIEVLGRQANLCELLGPV